MSQNKTKKVQIRLYLSQDKISWLNEMESLGCDRSALIELSLNLLIPRTESINTTNERIQEILLVKEELEY